jgi:hypothetical protein
MSKSLLESIGLTIVWLNDQPVYLVPKSLKNVDGAIRRVAIHHYVFEIVMLLPNDAFDRLFYVASLIVGWRNDAYSHLLDLPPPVATHAGVG